jgi:tripartite ATP-independent transporter DctP family solute receptor
MEGYPMKKTLMSAVKCVSLGVIASVAWCGVSFAAPEFVMKVGNVSASDGPYTLGMHELKRLVESYSNGRIEVQVYDNGQLGQERDLVEALGMGSVEGCVVSTGPVTNFNQNFFSFDFPYLITDLDKAWTVFDGDAGRKLLKELENIGIVGMDFWGNGFYHFANSVKPLVHPADLKGMKMRSMENEIYMAMYITLGATPAPMSVSDFSTAIRQKTVDGTNNALANINQYQWYESLKFMTLTYMHYSPAVFLMSKQFFDGLPPDLQEVVRKAAHEAALYERELSAKANGPEVIEKFKKEGVQFTDVDKEEWIKATSPVYDQFKNKVNWDYVQAFLDIR